MEHSRMRICAEIRSIMMQARPSGRQSPHRRIPRSGIGKTNLKFGEFDADIRRIRQGIPTPNHENGTPSGFAVSPTSDEDRILTGPVGLSRAGLL